MEDEYDAVDFGDEEDYGDERDEDYGDDEEKGESPGGELHVFQRGYVDLEHTSLYGLAEVGGFLGLLAKKVTTPDEKAKIAAYRVLADAYRSSEYDAEVLQELVDAMGEVSEIATRSPKLVVHALFVRLRLLRPAGVSIDALFRRLGAAAAGGKKPPRMPAADAHALLKKANAAIQNVLPRGVVGSLADSVRAGMGVPDVIALFVHTHVVKLQLVDPVDLLRYLRLLAADGVGEAPKVKPPPKAPAVPVISVAELYVESDKEEDFFWDA